MAGAGREQVGRHLLCVLSIVACGVACTCRGVIFVRLTDSEISTRFRQGHKDARMHEFVVLGQGNRTLSGALLDEEEKMRSEFLIFTMRGPPRCCGPL